MTCYNSMAADQHADEEGKKSEREAEIEKLEAQMLETLMEGGSVWTDVSGKGYENDASTILADRPGKPILKALEGWCTMNAEMHLDYLARVNEEARAEDVSDRFPGSWLNDCAA